MIKNVIQIIFYYLLFISQDPSVKALIRRHLLVSDLVNDFGSENVIFGFLRKQAVT